MLEIESAHQIIQTQQQKSAKTDANEYCRNMWLGDVQ